MKCGFKFCPGDCVHDRWQRCVSFIPRRGQLYADRQFRVEEAGILVPNELCKEPTRHGHHGGKHLCEGIRSLILFYSFVHSHRSRRIFFVALFNKED